MNPVTKADIERLRRRIERIEGGRMEPSPAPAATATDPEDPFTFEAPEHYDAERCLDGEVMENPHGKYFLHERFYPNHKLHGTFEISRLAETAPEHLPAISKGEILPTEPSRWVFLDTETTGLAGGTGTCAFLIGVGVIEPEGFRVKLFFMRDYDEEAAMLHAVSEFLQWRDVLVTYNGKTYDQPLLETRYRLRRQRPPFGRMQHLDLLHGARSLFKIRLESCRLVRLEHELLGLERHGDLPGELIPYYYFEYLRTKQAFRLAPMFHHNVMDIVSLACLTSHILPAFAAPSEAPLRHGEDLLGLARWLRRAGRHEAAAELYAKAIQAGVRDHELFKALWETAQLDKRAGRHDEKARILGDLMQVPNPYRLDAHEELAKHYERIEKDLEKALTVAEAGLELASSEPLEKRRARLETKVAKAAAARRLL